MQVSRFATADLRISFQAGVGEAGAAMQNVSTQGGADLRGMKLGLYPPSDFTP